VSKQLENMRKEIVAYPNTFTSTVNATFKGLKDRCQKARERLEYHASKYKEKKDAEYAQQQAEAAAAAEAGQTTNLTSFYMHPAEVLNADEGGVVPHDPPTPPLQSTKATEGGSVSYRRGRPQIEVTDAAKLIRTAMNTRSKVPMNIVQIDAAALRRAVDEGIYTLKQWAKYGVKVTETETMVVRS
jgi:hypothetical protein